VSEDPFAIFGSWYEEAGKELPVQRDVIALASATRDGRPSVRMVYYRGVREGGFSFFTNYESRKGRELAENPLAAIAFHWPPLGMQIRIEGAVQQLSPRESDAYFQGRPFSSKVTALISQQSQPMPNEETFREQLRSAEQEYEGRDVPLPLGWGGFKLVPSRFEFWSRGDYRRHRRMVYERDGHGWKKFQLYP